MKKLILIALIFLALKAKAQETYINMLDSNVVWSQVDITLEGPDYFKYDYIIMGDTFIDSKQYYKLFRDGSLDYEPMGFIRQNDSGKVYFRMVEENTINDICYVQSIGDPTLNSDLLLMDFGAQAGDTIQLPFNDPQYPSSGYIVVNSVELIEIEGLMRRVINFSDNFAIEGNWIEGIGSDMGLFVFWCPIGLGEYTQLRCYSNGEPIYGDCVTGIAEVITNTELLIYPNPASEMVNISVAENVKVVKVRVYEATGRVVIESANGLPLGEGGLRGIDVRNLQPGIYLIEVETEDGYREVKRVVIEK
jgi:hypothetical protein